VNTVPQTSSQSCWIATDGAKGNEKQCLALAHYLGVEPELFTIALREPWNSLAPHFRQGGRRAILGPMRDRLDGPLPDLLITAGRRSTLVSTTIRRLGGGSTFCIQVLNPRIDPAHFDVVVCPRHDGLSGDNVFSMIGAPHVIDDQTLSDSRRLFAELEDLPTPRVAMLVGASNGAYRIDDVYLASMAEAAERWAGEAGSIMVTTSRRTPPELCEWVRRRFANRPGKVWTSEADGANPYLGYLAWADAIVVSADSVNMVSEACGTSLPVLCTPPTTRNLRFQSFHRAMAEAGRVLPLDSRVRLGETFTPLRETRDIAASISDLIEERS
jgi:mitochondrial fission protein ELM1